MEVMGYDFTGERRIYRLCNKDSNDSIKQIFQHPSCADISRGSKFQETYFLPRSRFLIN
uniref:translational initiation factor 1 n=1 Tax=Ceratocephala orthoceras TaxID=286838 RepID=UPI0030E41D98